MTKKAKKAFMKITSIELSKMVEKLLRHRGLQIKVISFESCGYPIKGYKLNVEALIPDPKPDTGVSSTTTPKTDPSVETKGGPI